jgi:hypothetical protein
LIMLGKELRATPDQSYLKETLYQKISTKKKPSFQGMSLESHEDIVINQYRIGMKRID